MRQFLSMITFLIIAPVANTSLGILLSVLCFIFPGFIIIASHHVTTYNGTALPYAASYTNHTILNTAGVYDAAFGNKCFFQRGATFFAGGSMRALLYTTFLLSNKLNKGISKVKARLASKNE